MRRALPALLFAVLLATAGCSGAFGVDSSGTRTTQSTTDATTGPTGDESTPDADNRPPGLTTDGVTDLEALVDAHANALDGQSVTLSEERVRCSANGTLLSRTNLTLRVAANRTQFRQESHVTGNPVYGASGGRVVTFGDGERVYREVETANASWSTVLRRPNGDPIDAASFRFGTARTDDLYVALDAFALDQATVRPSDGDDRYRIESSTLAHPDLLASHLDFAAVRNASVTVVVTPEGMVRRYHLEFVAEKDGAVVRGRRPSSTRPSARRASRRLRGTTN